MTFLGPQELKRALPLAFVALELGVQINDTGWGLCPFHVDVDPSFGLYLDDQDVERWHCFPCGDGGDVFDLIKRVEGVGFNDALLRAQALLDEVPPNFQAPALQRAEPNRAAWDQLVIDSLRRAEENQGWVCVAAGIVRPTVDLSLRRAYDELLRTRWRWGVSEEGHVAMPHYDATGQLLGIKYRSVAGDRTSEPGSAFTALYGAWVQRRSRYVLLTEGETDTGFAAIQDPPVDVLGLPAGAGKFLDEWGALEADTYFLAFDADPAGFKATMRWLDALEGRDVRVCRLPRGHDLGSARPLVADLLRYAVRPTPAPTAIKVQHGRFEREGGNQEARPLCSWFLEPVARLESTDDSVTPALEVDVHSGGQITRDVLTMTDLHAAGKLRTWAGSRSLDCMITDNDSQQLTSYLLAQSAVLPEVFQTARVGAHAPPDRYRYAGRAVVAPGASIGRLPWRYVGPPEAEQHVHLADDGPVDWNWLRALLALNDESVTTPLLAWLVAATRRDEVTNFPILFLGGSSGSGKTTTARLACQLLGSTLTASLASITQFALVRALSMSTTIPVFVDEWSLQSRVDARETIQAVIPILYEGGVTTRGRADLSVAEYRLTAPILLAGEDSFHLDREAERMIPLRLQRGTQDFTALRTLSHAPLQRFAHWLYDWLVTAEELPPMPRSALTRPEYNAEVLEAGWATLGAYLAHSAEEGAVDVPELPDLNLSQLGVAREARENEYEAFIQAGESLRDGHGVPLVWPDDAGRGTWVRFRMLTSHRNLGQVDVELPGRSRAMKQYFADRFHLTDERVIPPLSAGGVTRATLIHGFSLTPE